MTLPIHDHRQLITPKQDLRLWDMKEESFHLHGQKDEKSNQVVLNQYLSHNLEGSNKVWAHLHLWLEHTWSIVRVVQKDNNWFGSNLEPEHQNFQRLRISLWPTIQVFRLDGYWPEPNSWCLMSTKFYGILAKNLSCLQFEESWYCHSWICWGCFQDLTNAKSSW